MRLTIKAKEPYEFAEDNFILNERIRVNYQQNISNDVYYVLGTLLNKLGQLEDIEEELGIDLVTLFKAFKNGIWIKYNLGSRTYNYKTGEDKETGDQIVFHKAPYKTLVENIGYFRRLFEKEYAENYGKTWALTKEELINEKED